MPLTWAEQVRRELRIIWRPVNVFIRDADLPNESCYADVREILQHALRRVNALAYPIGQPGRDDTTVAWEIYAAQAYLNAMVFLAANKVHPATVGALSHD